MLAFGIKLEGKKKAKGEECDRKSQVGFLHFFPVLPLIRKALCKSSYDKIRGSKKDFRVECYNLLPRRLVASDGKPLG